MAPQRLGLAPHSTHLFRKGQGLGARAGAEVGSRVGAETPVKLSESNSTAAALSWRASPEAQGPGWDPPLPFISRSPDFPCSHLFCKMEKHWVTQVCCKDSRRHK